jgi:CheY-like chemotaxis protein
MKKSRILVVDDDADIRKAIGIRLKASGYEPVFAADGFAATKLAIREQPDVILLDLGLPAGDGFVVMERFRQHETLSAVPVIVMTARDPETNRDRAKAAGCFAYLQKPPDNDQLLSCIQQALGQ